MESLHHTYTWCTTPRCWCFVQTKLINPLYGVIFRLCFCHLKILYFDWNVYVVCFIKPKYCLCIRYIYWIIVLHHILTYCFCKYCNYFYVSIILEHYKISHCGLILCLGGACKAHHIRQPCLIANIRQPCLISNVWQPLRAKKLRETSRWLSEMNGRIGHKRKTLWCNFMDVYFC